MEECSQHQRDKHYSVGFPCLVLYHGDFVPQLNKCLKFNSIWRHKNGCTLFKITSEVPQVLLIIQLWHYREHDNHLTLFKERNLSDEDRVYGIFNRRQEEGTPY